MRINYHHVFRNDFGFLEVEVETYPNVESFSLVNQNYCDNGKWLFIKCFTNEEFEIQVNEDDEFEVLEK